MAAACALQFQRTARIIVFEGCDPAGDFAEPKSLLGGAQALFEFPIAVSLRHLLLRSGQNGFGFCHRPKFPERYMSWQMIEAARTGYDGLLRRQPSMCCDPIGNQLPVLDVGGLHIDGAHAELFVPEQTLIMRGNERGAN